MSKYIEVMVIVEGKTEQLFIENIVAPYLGYKNIGMRATQISKPGQKGGDVKFIRVQRDLGLHLKQRKDTFVTTFVDYYGLIEWPGLDSVKQNAKPHEIANIINSATKREMADLFPDFQIDKRFIPFIAVHEFEAFLFCDSSILSEKLGIKVSQIDNVLSEFNTPEAINNSPQTAPSKRLDAWSAGRKFPKTTMGIDIANMIGIEKIRNKYPLFHDWLKQFEQIVEKN